MRHLEGRERVGGGASAVFAALLWASSGFVTPVHAYHVDARTQTVRIRSLKDFGKCQRAYESSGSEACLDALKAYVKRRPKDAFAAGKLARVHFMHWLALDFFAQALAKKPTKRQCADADVRLAVVSGLALPPHYPAVQLAKKLAQDSCWSVLNAALVSDLKGTGGYYRDNLCPLLADKKVSDRRCQRLKERPRESSSVLALLQGVDAATLSVDPEKTQALRSARGEELMIARANGGGREYVLLKFKGVKSPWNERVLLAIARPHAGGKDYIVAEDDRERIVMTERYGYYEAYPQGIEAGIWLSPVRPTTEPVHLPTKSQIANEFATVMP